MNGVISRLSPYGFQLKGEAQVDGKDVWHNLSKYEKGVSLNGYNVGDSVEFTANNKGYLTKLAKTGSAPAGAPAQAGSNGQDAKTKSGEPDAKDLRITRLSAASTAFAALPSLRAEGDSLDDLAGKAEKTAERITRYALTGSFDEPTKEEVPF